MNAQHKELAQLQGILIRESQRVECPQVPQQGFETVVKSAQEPFWQTSMCNVVMIKHICCIIEGGITNTTSCSE